MKKSSLLFLLFLLATSSAFAALRGTTGSAGTTSTTSNSITYAGAANIQVGDLIILVTALTSGNAGITFTDPSGFTACSALTSALADQYINSSDYLHCAVKIAVSGDAGTPTYTTSSSVAGYWKQQLRVYSGRVNTSINAAFPNNAVTAAGASGATPYAYSVTGLSSVPAGADVVEIVDSALPSGLSGATAFAISTSGFANALNTDYFSYNYNGPLQSLDYVDNPGGTIGPFSTTISQSGGSAPNVVPVAFVMELPAATAGCTHSGITSAGAIAVPNGTSGSYRLKNGSFGTPDCSTVSYYQTQGNFGVN